MEDILTSGILGPRRPSAGARSARAPVTTIEIRVAGGSIDNLGKVIGLDVGVRPVDAIAVGLYLGEKPAGVALDLDRSISRSLLGTTPVSDDGELAESDLLITQLAVRGTIRGELGQAFILPDPRWSSRNGQPSSQRVISIAGLGLPGRCREAELTVVVRELGWTLGRMGKTHLATGLIGAGRGNLDPKQAADAWIRGIKYAVTGSREDQRRTLRRITFIENDPERIQTIMDVIQAVGKRLEDEQRLKIDYQPLDEADMLRITKRWEGTKKSRDDEAARRWRDDDSDDFAPTRVTVTQDKKTYRFGAITQDASVPEREIPINPEIIKSTNDELAAAWDIGVQTQRGQLLEQLLLPEDLRPEIYSGAPLVLMLDASMARIHWEMVAQSENHLLRPKMTKHDVRNDVEEAFDGRLFLGTYRGLTRQLRTTFAPPPEPPPPPRRVLRVLVIADPAEEDRLPGAEEEGAAVADLFERFNDIYEGQTENRTEVVRLLGPQEATLTKVLGELTRHTYDVLHFAGHCVYDKDEPSASGWIFSKGMRISANELVRIDRIPKFVFSNACESGITPERSGERTAALAPSFAEAFFNQGVSNFVCTAWPVDDIAASEFALTVYEGLLGLRRKDANRREYTIRPPDPMHVAMRCARLAILQTPNGAKTWGAYQHYGNPYLRFFEPAGTPAPTEASSA